MGARGRRAGRGLRRAPVLAGEVGIHEPRFLVPATGLFFAAALGVAAIAIDRLASQVAGPWFEVLGAAVVVAALAATWRLLSTGWRRYREGLRRRALLWGVGGIATILLGLLAVYALIQSASFASVISGADVHLTRPVLQSLPRPAGASLISEQPGLADTESISDDFSIRDLSAVIPFYEKTLPKSGWIEDPSTTGGSVARFSKGAYVISVAPDQLTGVGNFTITVDHVNPNLLGSPSPSTSP
jgi:succinate dehydrogenase hydrophobic anchor subunit